MKDCSELVNSVRSGNLEAFGVLYDRFGRLVRAICYDRLGHQADAEDLAQEVFLTAFDKLDQLQNPEKFGSWSDVIQVNVEPPATLFSFQAPKGYDVTTVEKPEATNSGAKLFRVGEGGSNTTWLGSWHSFNINDRVVLTCWFQHDTAEGEKLPFARQPEFELYGGNAIRPCREHTVSTNVVNDAQWRWSLIFPEDGGPIGEDTLRFMVSDKKTRASQESKPLRIPIERLQEIILEAQRRTLPDESEKKLFTLEDLEEIE